MSGKRKKNRAFRKNGGMLLEKLVATCNGKPPIPIRNFSEKELRLATNNYDPQLVLHRDGPYAWYKGSFEGRNISIKKATSIPKLDMVFTDIAISAKVSAHKNVLKLVGCCLETQVPILVHESIENGTFANRILGSNCSTSRPQHEIMAWQSKFKVAREISHAIAYLHAAFSTPIIHMNINPHNIFFDQYDVPKLSDFSLSVLIPKGETHVEAYFPYGTWGFVCPSYFKTNLVTEKSDVYTFGALLLELLVGQRTEEFFRGEELSTLSYLIEYVGKHSINEIVSSSVLEGEGAADLGQQMQALRVLALTCTKDDPKNRPTMVDVTKELRRIERFVEP